MKLVVAELDEDDEDFATAATAAESKAVSYYQREIWPRRDFLSESKRSVNTLNVCSQRANVNQRGFRL